MNPIISFPTPKAALAWFAEYARTEGLEYADNFRFGFRDNAGSMRSYDKLRLRGCCGEDEADVMVAGRQAIVGCNYGH